MLAMVPRETMAIPRIIEVEDFIGVASCGAMYRRKRPNFAMTNPNPINEIAVRIHASNVRSAAK